MSQPGKAESSYRMLGRSNCVTALADFKNNNTIQSMLPLCDMFSHLLVLFYLNPQQHKISDMVLLFQLYE